MMKRFCMELLKSDRSKIVNTRRIKILTDLSKRIFFVDQNCHSYPPCFRGVLRLPATCNDVMQYCSKDRTFFNVMTLIWSNRQADEPALEFLMIEAISA